MGFAVTDLRPHLLGQWRVERTMQDRATGAEGSFSGTVVFADDGDALRQSESGTVVWPAYRGPASRTYRLLSTADPAVMDVLFADGRPFHSLDLSRGSWTATHSCPPDRYRVSFTAPAADRLDYTWDVTGPAKDLMLCTSLFRLG